MPVCEQLTTGSFYNQQKKTRCFSVILSRSDESLMAIASFLSWTLKKSLAQMAEIYIPDV